MPFTPTGRDVALSINPATGRYDLAIDVTGNTAYTDDESHAVLSRLAERQGQWWADAAGTQGSRLYAERNITRQTPSQLQALALEALGPLIQAGRISDVEVTAAVLRAEGRAILQVRWRTPGGRQHALRYALESR